MENEECPGSAGTLREEQSFREQQNALSSPGNVLPKSYSQNHAHFSAPLPLVISEENDNESNYYGSAENKMSDSSHLFVTSPINGDYHSPKPLEEGPSTANDPLLVKISTTKRRRVRGPKSWEYLLRLLRDPSTNPSLIRWENEIEGIFRLVKPDSIALRWGKRTGKHSTEMLSYENFARGLRYHYVTGALTAVSERCFVYKFGPKAQNAICNIDDTVNCVPSKSIDI